MANVAHRAAVIEYPGALPEIRPFEVPPRRPGQTLLEVKAAGLNPLDITIASGSIPSVRMEDPYIPGIECIGTVIESETYPPGELVYAETRPGPQTSGTFATHVTVRDEAILRIPAGVDPAEATAVGNSGVAAFMPLIEIARLAAGEVVLILGATGVLGHLAVQIAKQHGAGHVTAVGRNPQSLAVLRDLGADATVQLTQGERMDDLIGRLAQAGPSSNVILDALFGTALPAALATAAHSARVVNVGNAIGHEAALPAGLLRGKELTVHGFASFGRTASEKAPGLNWLWRGLVDGTVCVDTLVRSLDELPAAWIEQGTSPHAKLVIAP